MTQSLRGMEMETGESIGSFLESCGSCDADRVAEILDSQPSADQLNERDRTGKTGLSHLCLNGFSTILELLTCRDLPLDPNLPDNEGNTPLIHAAQAGHSDIVGLLLRTFPTLDVDQRNALGFTALIKSAIQGRHWCAKLLLASGASPYLRDPSRGFCALEWADYCGRVPVVQVLAQYMDSFPPPDPTTDRKAMSGRKGSGCHCQLGPAKTKLITRRRGKDAAKSPIKNLEDVARVVAWPVLGEMEPEKSDSDVTLRHRARLSLSVSCLQEIIDAEEGAKTAPIIPSRVPTVTDDNFFFESGRLVNKIRRRMSNTKK